MDIYPALDLHEGKCVRLHQGEFKKKTVYSSSPLEVASFFAEAGAKWIHIVDLSGAQKGSMIQEDLILKIAKEIPVKIQVGGGIRTQKQVDSLLKNGVERVVLGSLILENPSLVKKCLKDFGSEHLTLAVDVNFKEKEQAFLRTQGWQKKTPLLLWEVVEEFSCYRALHFLCTDIQKDGCLRGINKALYREASKKHPHLNWIASGGVTSLRDLSFLKTLGMSGVILGKALYEMRFTLKEALAC